MDKLNKSFYLQSAAEVATKFLGKVLVHNTPFGRIAGFITEVEAYPAFIDKVHHGLKKTSRSEVMHREGGYAYVYLIYGKWYQFSAVVGKENIPDVVFIRAVYPTEGIKIMKRQWQKSMNNKDLSNSPGKLCKSFLITKVHYGIDLTGEEVFLEDWNITVLDKDIVTSSRVGIDAKHEGHDKLLRFQLSSKKIDHARLERF